MQNISTFVTPKGKLKTQGDDKHAGTSVQGSVNFIDKLFSNSMPGIYSLIYCYAKKKNLNCKIKNIFIARNDKCN